MEYPKTDNNCQYLEIVIKISTNITTHCLTGTYSQKTDQLQLS